MIFFLVQIQIYFVKVLADRRYSSCVKTTSPLLILKETSSKQLKVYTLQRVTLKQRVQIEL